mmetsp:Transcript_68845/g.154169  ORF Transcript_68845/g.154169 Transcript_68845/m.154169 type:complete len:233 (-) Transcript_68845:66-764(-)
MVRRASLVAAVAALLVAPQGCKAASSSRSTPSYQELSQKSTKELKDLLKRKGVKCKKCVDKDDLINRVIETWDQSPKEAASPDGAMRMTKELFLKNLKDSYLRQLKSEHNGGKDGHQLDADDDEQGGADIPQGLLPSDEQLEQVWKEFSEKLAIGEVSTDENGQLVYEVPPLGGAPGVWERWRVHIMMVANVALLWCIQRTRRKNRELTSARTEPGQATSEEGDNDKAKKKR